MGYFLDNHFANTSIFSFIALSAANIAKIVHFRFLLIFNSLSCFVNYFGFMIHVLALQKHAYCRLSGMLLRVNLYVLKQ